MANSISDQNTGTTYVFPLVISFSSVKNEEATREKLLAYFNKLVGPAQTCPFAQTKLLVVGRETDDKELFLNSVFGKDQLVDDENVWKNRIIRGHFDVSSFKQVDVKVVPTLANPRFVLWDYTWKEEYSFLENLFLTMQTVYVVLFDAKAFLKDEDKDAVISYLRLFLGSKRIYGRDSLALLVGLNSEDLSEEDIGIVNGEIMARVLVGAGFKAVFNGVRCFFPVSASAGTGIDTVKTNITATILARKHIKDRVPKALLQSYNNLITGTSATGYIDYYSMRKLFSYKVTKSYQVTSILHLMALQGMVIYFGGVPKLEAFLVYRPEFLLKALQVAVYRDGGGFTIDFDGATMGGKFANFNVMKILEKEFLFHVWDRLNFSEEKLKNYLIDLLIHTKIVVDYEFDATESYLVPTFYNPNRDSNINEDNFSGARFVIDFSGQSSTRFADARFVKYMPSGFFEKLVVTCLELSGSYRNPIQPIVEYHKAQISFGGVRVFMLKVIKDKKGGLNWIECKVIPAAKYVDVLIILRRVYTMVQGLKHDIYDGARHELAVTPLLEASEEGNKYLAEFNRIRSNRGSEELFGSAESDTTFVQYDHFKQWFSELDGQDFTPFNPEEVMNYNPPQEPMLELGSLKYHCFLSYKETSAKEVVKKQYDLLTRRGFTCWLDSETGGNNQAKEVYLDGVRNCACFVLVLSKDVFSAPLIIEEINIARELEKKIIFLHHPDTGRIGQDVLEGYKENAPNEMHYLFDTCEQYKLEKRFYMHEVITNRLDRSIRRALASQ